MVNCSFGWQAILGSSWGANRGVLHDDKEETAIRNLALLIESSRGDHLLDLNLKLVVDVLDKRMVS